ncbi:MAG: 3-phosphoshikimate 1-carboxyvinyltransferase [Acidobacteriota bacterium]|nr:3-phosphoshikimate 1-carboxyvinyltransferase [Acidobacteriota bacterium]
MRISKSGPLTGRIKVPGDKSISHRAAMLLAISKGSAEITNFATGDDCASTLRCLKALGVPVSKNGSTVQIFGKGKRGLEEPATPLDCGNSGTTMRLLAGILAGQEFDSLVVGDESLNSRPMGRIAEPLLEMGADIRLRENRAPIKIMGGACLRPIDYSLPVASAQVKSCVLIAGLYTGGPVSVISPPSELRAPISRDHTERMLTYLGAEISEEFREADGEFSHVIKLSPGSELQARDIRVPGDISTAAFFLVAAAGLRGSDITLLDVGLNDTRKGIVDVMQEIGVRIEVTNKSISCGEPRGDIRVSWDGDCELIESNLKISGGRTAALIDEMPVLAVLGTLLPGGIEVRDASELRVKESDRVDAIVKNLKRMGGAVEEYEDGFRVSKSNLTAAEIDSRGDHRIAMAFAVAAMFSEGESVINDAGCVAVSYPDFFETLNGLVD